MHASWLIPFSLVVLLAGCARQSGGDVDPPETAPVAENGPQPTRPPDRTIPTTTPPTPGPPPTTEAIPVFTALVGTITERELGASWRPDCPVPVEDLRRLDLAYWDYQGAPAVGAVIVHADQAEKVVRVFAALFDARFPIESLRPIAEFGADDDASMAANNTSGFNCREIDGRPGVWSQHAFGGAIDINPLVNPWVRGSLVDPPGGEPYVDRSTDVPGLIRAGDAVTSAFAEVGWSWGGDWTSTVDYQHFSHDGR